MTPAAVGFQCPNCVAAGQQVVRGTHANLTVASPDARPVVSWTLIGMCVAVYAAQFLVGVDEIAGSFGMQPVAIALGGEYFRLLTSVFLHGSLLHLMFNMYVLFVLGPTMERILGHGRFALLFVVSGLGGAAASYALSAPTTLSVGASGAIFGVMGALAVAGRRLRFDITMVLVLIAINIVIGFVFSAGIDWRAHLGGLLTGAAMAAVLVSPTGRRRISVEVVGVAVIVGVIALTVAYRSAQLSAFAG